MQNPAQVIDLNQRTKSDSEAIFIKFLILVETWVATPTGSLRGLDLLENNPKNYWTASRWEYLSVDDVIWLAQVWQVPAHHKVSRKWADTSKKAKAKIYAQTQVMATRAKKLLVSNKEALNYAVS